MFSKALLNALILALVVAPNLVTALVQLPLTRHFNHANAANIVKHDQARARYMMTGKRSVSPFPIINEGTLYTAEIGVGNPPTSYTLLIDTGSSNTWLGANKTYARTKSSIRTKESVDISYGAGEFQGLEYKDSVTIGGLVISNQSIGVGSFSSPMPYAVDGILGIGPVDLTLGTLSPSNATIPTVTDNLFSQGLIEANEVGISFEPTNKSSVRNGELTWGGVDQSKFFGSLHYAPVTSESPSNHYWGIGQTIMYGKTTILDKSSVGYIDTGTTGILLAEEPFLRYQNATGATYDEITGLLTITHAQYEKLLPLDFIINGKTFTLTRNAQIWPRALNPYLGGIPGVIYLVVADIGGPTGLGLDFVNGYSFLERFYTAYDTANKRIGFGVTPFTYARVN
ncbi:aspartic peptidase A1 [Amanita rubescens]|nr:aspartic peptidase A1 [Amanita rubescens]